jgi:hypothetical protein
MIAPKTRHVFSAVFSAAVISAAAVALFLIPAGAQAQDASTTTAAVEGNEQLTLGEDVLSQYVGVYQLAPNVTMAITLENGTLFTQLTGQPKFALSAESETRFALTAIPAAIEFERDAAGAVTAAVLHQNGRSLRAPRA